MGTEAEAILTRIANIVVFLVAFKALLWGHKGLLQKGEKMKDGDSKQASGKSAEKGDR